ncbi:MAG TPA: carboxypeptidase regulatory-like domain-containing protein, partial [Kofleriaceae bacterium]|nr:carboxypeptidase regulatory-like domain-containing protein [Kofleriaceae bacterium]
DSGASSIVPADLAAKHDQTVALTLAITGAITGTVVDNKGQPIADAQVIAEADEHGDPAERTAWMVRGVQETTTDQGGSFRFAGLPDGTYRVRAARPSASEAALWLSRGVAATPNAAPIQVVVAGDGRATGKVVFDDGKPATAFTVRLEDTRPLAFVTKDGAFAVPAVAGTYTLTVAGPGFVTTGKQVTIAEGKDTDAGTITVHPGRSITGRVLDEHGSPVAKATVAAGALLTGGGADLYIKSESIGAKDTETDAQGRFALDGFPPAPLTVVAGKPGAGRSASVQLPATSDSATLDLVLGPTAGLAGKVTRGGQPLADTVVIANPVGAMASNFFVTTGPDGTFTLDALTPGAYLVYPMIGGGGNAPKDMYMRRVEVAAGAKTTTELDATPGPVTLDVSVKTDKGAAIPMAGLLAIALTIDPESAEQLRDGSLFPVTDTTVPMHMRMVMGGAAEIANMRPGAYTLCALFGDPRSGNPPKKCTHVQLTPAAKQTAAIVVPDALLHH